MEFDLELKVLLINGSPHKEGNTFLALSEAAKTLHEEGVKTQIVHIGVKPLAGCIACGKCRETGKCVFADDVYNTLCQAAAECDGIIIGSPVYFAGPNGALCALLDRLFFSRGADLAYKPAAAVAVCRRGGASASFDRLNKYFTILNMPVVSSQYWNSVHGRAQGEAVQDAEGMQTMRTLGRNMAWLLKKIHKDSPQHPQREEQIMTNFIR